VAAVSAPRLTGGAIASIVLHAGLIAAFLMLRPGSAPPSPPIYRVQLFAAPPGERNPGVVQPPTEAPPVEKPPPPAKTSTPRPKVPSTKPKAPPPQKAATATAPPKAPVETKPTPQPTAGGGETGGKGADVANIDTNGLEFPYPWYTTNVVSLILRQFRSTNARFIAEVRFVIQRDGTVDPASIKFVTRSGNYPFDMQAYGAVEAASKDKAFGALPPGFHEDILPVTFRFSPSLSK
jgi:outer membrane biosynthesis protein TonB